MSLLSRRVFVCASLLVVAASAAIAFSFPTTPDYEGGAGASINAMLDGVWNYAFSHQTVMGSFSLFLRAPFVWLGQQIDNQNTDLWFQLGTMPCLIAAGMTGLLVARTMAKRGRPGNAQAIVAILFLINPVTFNAVSKGHPEELLAASFCILAMLAAFNGKTLLTGLLLGLAIATKQWAVLAVIPASIALPQLRVRAALLAAGVVLVLALPMAIGDFGQFTNRTERALNISGLDRATPANIWAPFSESKTVTRVKIDDNEVLEGPHIVAHSLPPLAGDISRPLIVLLAIPLSLLFVWQRRKPGPVRDASKPEDVLALLALLFMLRCVLDPFDTGYYHVPMLMALLTFQGLRNSGLPLLSVAVTAALAVTDKIAGPNNFTEVTIVYLVWAIPLVAWLSLLTFAPQRVSTIVSRARERFARPSSAAMHFD